MYYGKSINGKFSWFDRITAETEEGIALNVTSEQEQNYSLVGKLCDCITMVIVTIRYNRERGNEDKWFDDWTKTTVKVKKIVRTDKRAFQWRKVQKESDSEKIVAATIVAVIVY